MERTRSVSQDSLVINMPRGSRQYWEGQYDALVDCSRMLRHAATQTLTPQQLKLLAEAIATKARLMSVNKQLDEK